jgi:argininosuccinate lyase
MRLSNGLQLGKTGKWTFNLARYDVLGSMAHVTMLGEVGLLEANEVHILLKGLALSTNPLKKALYNWKKR